MHSYTIITIINAPIQRCFDLARSVDAHLQTSKETNERVVAGKTTGLLELNEEITWEGRHFGIVQRFSSRITAFEPYSFFQDRMTQGAFKFFEHDHLFEQQGDQTIMTDILRYKAPFGPLGWIAERTFLKWHLRRFIINRAEALKAMAEVRI